MLKKRILKHLYRETLLKKISTVKEVPLMLVVAPMGYGKSSAVHAYIQKNNLSHIWISVGTEPLDDERLWNRIGMEFKTRNSEFYECFSQLGRPTSANWEQVQESAFVSLLKQTYMEKDFYLVIDDYPSGNTPIINRLITRIVYEDIPGFHIILISRTYPSFAFEELILKSYCFLISQTDFTLTPDEIEEIFRLNGISLDADEAKKVYEYTDGWIAAVNLLELEYRQKGVLQFGSSITRLIRTSIYDKLTAKEQEFLYLMCLFPEFSLAELEAVYGGSISFNELELLMEKTGLIHYHSQKGTYSLHSLLREVVKDMQKKDPSQYFSRYAAYQEANGDLTTAITYYEKTQDVEAILRILDGDERFAIIAQLPGFLMAFFQKNQANPLLFEHPTALLSVVHSVIISGDIKLAQDSRRFFTYVKEYYEEHYKDAFNYADICGELKIVESQLYFNDTKPMSQALADAWELRGHKPSQIFIRKVYSYGVPETLFMYHQRSGSLLETVEGEKEYSRNYMRLIYNIHGSLETLVDAEYALETGDMEACLKLAQQSLEQAKFHNQICIVISSYLVLLRSYIFFGRKQSFDAAIKDCAAYMKNINYYLLKMDYEQMCGYVYGIINQLDKIPLWLRERNIDNCNQIIRDTRNGCIIHGLFLLHKKQWARLSSNAAEMALPYMGTHHVFTQIYAGIFDSIALWNQNARVEAEAAFEQALALARPDGIVMPFAELSEALVPLLDVLSKKKYFTTDSFFQKLISFSADWRAGALVFEEHHYSNAVFTDRENQIVKLLITGCRNNEIARQLNIAPVTVEKNLTNIYRKIGVANRTSAIQWYLNVYSQA